MRFVRLGAKNAEEPAILYDGSFRSISSLTVDIDREFWESDGPSRVRAALAQGDLPVIADAEARRIGAPVSSPGAVVCIGLNYSGHANESGAPIPAAPVMFLKHPNTVSGPYDTVQIPPGSSKTDWEVELGVVIGKRVSYLPSPASSIAHVAGFLLANDVSERTFQLETSGGQWSKGKCAADFTPLGPWLVTPDEVDHQNLALRSFVNGQLRQSSTTADQIFDVAYVIFHLSQHMVLDAGDLILTGTPEGVALSGRFPYLEPGDVVELELDGLGRQCHAFVAYEGA